MPTSKHAIARRLLESETFHRAVLDGIELGVVTTDALGKVTFVNRTARELLGAPSACGTDVRHLLGLHSLPEELVSTTPKLAFVLPSADGDDLDIELSVGRATGFHDVTGYYFVFRDVREEKSRSAERERFARLAAIGTMVAGFAHEVRNPVAALRSLAESLADDLADSRLHFPHVSRMLKVLERVERLVRTSLQFGRPAAPRRAHHRPWTIMAGALGEVGPRTRELGGEVRVEVEPDLPDVLVDDVQLIQVIVVLLNNALDSVGMPRRVLLRGSRGTFSTSEGMPPAIAGRACVRLEVRDDGPGIPAEILERIFDPFFTTKASGTGLGLSIAQHIVSENGGSIEVSSPRGGPTSFSVLVPAA